MLCCANLCYLNRMISLTLIPSHACPSGIHLEALPLASKPGSPCCVASKSLWWRKKSLVYRPHPCRPRYLLVLGTVIANENEIEWKTNNGNRWAPFMQLCYLGCVSTKAPNKRKISHLCRLDCSSRRLCKRDKEYILQSVIYIYIYISQRYSYR